MLLIFLIEIVFSCSTYMCKPTNMTFTDSTCVYSVSASNYLSVCSSPYYCSLNSTSNSTCVLPSPSPPPEPAYPGESCQSNSDCLSENCVSNVCIGLHWLESCNSTSQCHVGLFCLNSTCWFQLGEFQQCNYDTDCKNNMGCFIRVLNQPGICIKYYSLATSKVVFNCNNRMSNFCQSGNCGGPGGKGFCIDGIRPRYLSPYCQQDSDCPGESFGWQFYSTCNCGYNSLGTKYCQPFLGDFIGVQYINSLTDWYASNQILNCHTEKRINSPCMAAWNGYQNYLKNFYYWRDFPLLQNNDDCVKQIYTQYYWQL